MNEKQTPLYERLWQTAGAALHRHRTPFFSALLVGLAAHGYAFFNKLVNHDEIESLFGKGATVTSGRWGLEAVKLLFPDWSMPWIYGLLSLLLMALACCMMLELLDIRSGPLQALCAALVVSFPSLTGIFCFMFTSSAYACSFLLSVLAVAAARRGGLPMACLGALLLTLALGIYQAYIAVTAGLFLLRMMAEAMDAERPVRDIVLDGVRALLLMAAAIALYYAVTLLVFRFTGAQFNDYVAENVNGGTSLLRRVRIAYDNFFYIYGFRNFYLIPYEFLRVLHIVLGAITLIGMALLALRRKKPLHAALLLVLTLLLPLCVCCMFLIMSPRSIHTLVLYGFVAVYLLTALVIERMAVGVSRPAAESAAIFLAIIVAGNVYFANMCYLKLQLQLDSARAFYTALSAQIKSTEGFDENSRLALIGHQDNLLYDFPELDTELFLGVSRDLVNIYSRENLFRCYLGFAIPFADEAELAALERDPRVQAMAEYPYFGSVRKLDDWIVVRLG